MTTSDSRLNRQRRTSAARDDRWQRWNPAPIRPPAQPPAESASNANRPTPAADVRKLKAKLQQAKQEAQASGHEKGYQAGYKEGLKAGQEAGYKAGYEDGLQAGQEHGQAAGAEAAQQVVSRLNALAQSTATALTQVESDMGQALITLAVRIAEKVVHDSITARPEQLLSLINSIVQMESEHHSALTLHVHPEDLPLIESHLSENSEKRRWHAVADADITRGGCRISTPLGDIDATLETRWTRVVSTLGES